MLEWPSSEELDFKGPKGETLFRHFVVWCIPSEWQSTVQQEIDATFAYLSSEDDRAVALVGALLVESAIDELVAAFVPGYEKLTKNSDFTFSMRIQLARALKLCPGRLFGGADTIRDIRNTFAHKLAVKSFDECEPKVLGSARGILCSINPGLENGKSTREVFINLAAMLFLGLRGYKFHVERVNEYVRSSQLFMKGLQDYCKSKSSLD